jgi:hypothetical protein
VTQLLVLAMFVVLGRAAWKAFPAGAPALAGGKVQVATAI